MKLRVGLVGLGDYWQSRHRPALRALADRFEVKAICCEVAEKSKLVADEFSATPMDGFRAMVERDDIDAVLALAPDWIGPLPIIAACEAGKAVYSSAALDISFDQAREIRQRVDESGVAFMAELPRRFAPATLRLKELIATRLGRPRILFCHERMPVEGQLDRLRRGDYCPLAWRHIMELVDWCHYLVESPPSTVSSARHESPTDEGQAFYQMVSLDFPAYKEDGIRPLAQLSLGHYIPAKWKDALTYRRPASIQVCCERGMAFIDLPNTLIWFDDGGQHTESLESERSVGEQMLIQFHRSVTSLVRNRSDLADAYQAMQVVLSANESARTGQRISLDYNHE
ncbi:MAG: Gfo/Idh/MocA family oxidoreductase [Mariniblastus sp.]|nr:Gfo/Idh/MocA family oxidoreductase [Mariniblastus sp.]